MKKRPKWERWVIRAKKFACYQGTYIHNALFSLYASHEKRNGEAKRKCVLGVDERRKRELSNAIIVYHTEDNQ